MNKTKKLKIFLICLISIVIIFSLAIFFYISDYNHSEISIAEMENKNSNIYTKNNLIIFNSETKSDVGFIFYPGGKVEYSSYAPLLESISKKGVTCILVKMPANLAVLGANKADSIYSEFPEIKNWYIGGHSLGGAMASSYVKKNSDKLNGLILLAAYPINDSKLPTISIYGSEDRVFDLSKLNSVTEKFEIQGGNHAQFGNYGEQKGDGSASISREDQQKITVDEILKFIAKNK